MTKRFNLNLIILSFIYTMCFSQERGNIITHILSKRPLSFFASPPALQCRPLRSAYSFQVRVDSDLALKHVSSFPCPIASLQVVTNAQLRM